MSIQLRQPDYFVVYVGDMQRSMEFYRDMLGLSLKFSTPGWTEFELGNVKLALHRSGTAALPPHPGQPPAGVAQIAFVVKDIQAVYNDLQSKGIRFSLAPEVQVTGNTIAVLHDPDGFGITLQQINQ